MRVRLKLRSKFYILILPAALILVGALILLMLPQNRVQYDVKQINEGLAEVVSAEGFARHYERQLRECAAFVATGSTEHERLYEQAQQNAQIDIGGWIKAEAKRTGDPPTEHAQEIEAHQLIRSSYFKVSQACDWAVALARSGQQVAAMNHLADSANGTEGNVVSEGIDEQLPEEEAQLNRYLDNLGGAMQALSIMRLLGLQSTVESMRAHVSDAMLAERFSRYYNQQVKESLVYIVTGRQGDFATIAEAQDNAGQTIDTWIEQADQLKKESERGKSTKLVDRLNTTYDKVNGAWDKAVTLLNAGDKAGAIGYVESETGPSPQSNLTAAINNEVVAQQEALTTDADYISSSSRNASWGVGIFGVLVLVIALGGTLLISRMVVGPVVQLRDAAMKFGKSGTDVEVKIKSHDELGDLAASFNEMATARSTAEAEMLNTRDELEDRVEERTRELEHLNDELVVINKELNDFAYVVSHDLKAPLRGIGSLATWLASDYADVLDDTGKEQLQLLLDRAKKMESLIESVLKYSRVGRIREDREVVDTNELVDSSVEMIAPPENVQVSIEGKLPWVEGERTRLEQVFQNLIGNAVKFIDKPVGFVTISCVDEGAMWRFAVKDNGPGIDSRYYDQIFQIFQTLSPPDDKGSTGIGLTLVKKIVEMHGGTIWVESNLGEGSTFFFTLPK
ncbi:MAG TPA: ATP-binding protein [Candidatus Anoxymicrobiaceae bacterium]